MSEYAFQLALFVNDLLLLIEKAKSPLKNPKAKYLHYQRIGTLMAFGLSTSRGNLEIHKQLAYVKDQKSSKVFTNHGQNKDSSDVVNILSPAWVPGLVGMRLSLVVPMDMILIGSECLVTFGAQNEVHWVFAWVRLDYLAFSIVTDRQIHEPGGENTRRCSCPASVSSQVMTPHPNPHSALVSPGLYVSVSPSCAISGDLLGQRDALSALQTLLPAVQIVTAVDGKLSLPLRSQVFGEPSRNPAMDTRPAMFPLNGGGLPSGRPRSQGDNAPLDDRLGGRDALRRTAVLENKVLPSDFILPDFVLSFALWFQRGLLSE
ncbi:hypothetical protein E5288_WYG008054 [Bos mutus]|uniref:Uncharacterized protein n=1 Tax=Bos mutus TaxID=72004 RepID=A0A6B0RUS0_9CETA|nr:hypothetical protein [Bos mutus]